MEKLKIKIILGSTRPTRFGIQPAEFILKEAKKLEEFEVELVDLKDYPLPFFEEAISPSHKKEPYKNEIVEKLTNKIGEADGYIIVTPEYNYSFPAVLKNALDYISKEWKRKPVAFVSYGGVGGARAVEQLRLVASALQMVPIRHAILMQNFWSLLDDKGKLDTDSYIDPAKVMLTDLLWWTKTLKQGRQ